MGVFSTKSSSAEISTALKKQTKNKLRPAYEGKGINDEQAKALVVYMKSLKQ